MRIYCGKSKISPKSGQTVVEFAFVSMIFIFMLVLTFNTVVAFSVHQYLSYVTFMAARAYQAGNGSPQEQRTKALETFQRYIPQLGGLSPAPGAAIDVSANPVRFNNFKKDLALIKKVYIPVVAENKDFGSGAAMDRNVAGTSDRYVGLDFEVPFAQFPLGAELRNRFGRISLTTRSFLGREVSQRECRRFFVGVAVLLGGADPNAMEDQGC